MSPIRFLGLLLPLAAALPDTGLAQSTLKQHGEVVQACGGAVPGLPFAVIEPTFHLAFDNPTMDRNGTVLYRARMQIGGSVGADNNRAYFLGRNAADLQMVVRAGDQAPGMAAGTLLRSAAGSGGLSPFPRLSPLGETLFFKSSLYDPILPSNTPANSDSALFWGPPGSIVPLLREGDPVPFAGPGVTWGEVDEAVIRFHVNTSGRVLFVTSLNGASPGTQLALVTGLLGGLNPVLRLGQVHPSGGVVVAASPFSPLVTSAQLNEAGQVLHDVRFAIGQGGVTAANDYGIAVWTAGASSFVAREGQQAPGLPAGVVFADDGLSYNSGSFNKAGQTAVVAGLSGPGVVNGQNDQALCLGGAAGLSLVLRRGDPVPGLPGVTWRDVNAASVFVNDQAQVSFMAELGGAAVAGNDSGLWLGSAGSLQLIAREGDAVPGLLPSANGPWRYGPMAFSLTGRPYLGQHGYVMFQNTISDGVSSRNLWFGHTPALGIVTVLEDTDTFTTGLGTAGWTIATQFGSPNSSDSTPAWFNANGDFVCKLVLGSPAMGAIVRGHLGSLIATPSALPVMGGRQDFTIDTGPARGNQIYAVIASGLGTSPGFPSPFGPQTVPLNFDPLWTQVSLDQANGSVWSNTVWLTDANGRPLGVTPGFTMPPGFPGFQGITIHHAVVTLDSGLNSTFVSEPAALRLY